MERIWLMDQAATCDGICRRRAVCDGCIRIVAECMFCNAGKSSINHVVKAAPDHACKMISYPPNGTFSSPVMYVGFR